MTKKEFKIMRNERDVKENVKRVLRAAQPTCWWFMPVASGYGRAGIPDFVGCVNGHMFAVETKYGHGAATPMQVNELAAVNAAGGHTWIVRETSFDAWANEFVGWVALCS